MAKIIHGHTAGGCCTRTYRTWSNMISRCTRPEMDNYRFYGGRGIQVCERWKKFHNFLSDMGPRPTGKTLDRIDPDGHYEASNCRWASLDEQHRNRRNARVIRARGEAHNAPEWARILGVPVKTIYNRIYMGWPSEDVIEGRTK